MYESEADYFDSLDQEASEGLSSMELSELEEAESMGEIPPELTGELEDAAETGFTPEETSELEEQQETMASLPPAEAMQYEDDVTGIEDSAAEDEAEAGEIGAENFDEYIQDA